MKRYLILNIVAICSLIILYSCGDEGCSSNFERYTIIYYTNKTGVNHNGFIQSLCVNTNSSKGKFDISRIYLPDTASFFIKNQKAQSLFVCQPLTVAQLSSDFSFADNILPQFEYHVNRNKEVDDTTWMQRYKVASTFKCIDVSNLFNDEQLCKTITQCIAQRQLRIFLFDTVSEGYGNEVSYNNKPDDIGKIDKNTSFETMIKYFNSNPTIDIQNKILLLKNCLESPNNQNDFRFSLEIAAYFWHLGELNHNTDLYYDCINYLKKSKDIASSNNILEGFNREITKKKRDFFLQWPSNDLKSQFIDIMPQ
jgi:hypothetical protein